MFQRFTGSNRLLTDGEAQAPVPAGQAAHHQALLAQHHAHAHAWAQHHAHMAAAAHHYAAQTKGGTKTNNGDSACCGGGGGGSSSNGAHMVMNPATGQLVPANGGAGTSGTGTGNAAANPKEVFPKLADVLAMTKEWADDEAKRDEITAKEVEKLNDEDLMIRRRSSAKTSECLRILGN